MTYRKPVRIGIVCPYGWDAPGGVQGHIRDLAEYHIANGNIVSVLTPAVEEDALPPYVVSAGKPIAIPYNGAVARVLFGPIAFARVRQWISQNDFDILHLHEPAIPSLSLLACWAAEGPMVGTFHAAAKKQKAIFAIGPILEPVIEKLSARIAVSESARLTLTTHLDTDAIVIPNGIYCERFTAGVKRSKWTGNTVGFIGRFEEPRKGLSVLLEALPLIVREVPDIRVLVAGPGDSEEFMRKVDPQFRSCITFLGRLSESEKMDFLRSVDIYVAPNTGGESFGVILAEAMAAGACVVASDIPAFTAMLGNGQFGSIFPSENSTELSIKIVDLLREDEWRKHLAAAGQANAKRFDWSEIGRQIFSVYEMAMVGRDGVNLVSETRSWSRLLNRDEEMR